MIGRSLAERFGALKPLAPDVATRVLAKVLAERAADIVRVRAQDERMIACVVVDADAGAVRLCRALGFDMRRGGTAVFGLLGPDCRDRFPALTDAQKAWLEEPGGPRETKVLLVAGGVALLAIEAGNPATKSKTTIRAL